MSAIVLDPFKKILAQKGFDEVTSGSNKYYIGIGRSESWDSSETVPTPLDNPRAIRNARDSLQSIKSASDVSFVIPRYNWSSGSTYQGYDDILTSIPDTNPYAVMTEDNQVYLCIQGGTNSEGVATTSTVKPSGTTTKPFKTSDGYVWKYMYTLSAARASAFLSANFLPVEQIQDSSRANILVEPDPLSALEVLQTLVQDSAVPGQIIGIKVTSAGSGYTSGTQAVTIVGDGVRAAATATINTAGQVTKIELDSSTDSCLTFGQGYTNASITIGGSGTGATARAIIGPDSGLGADPREDLKATSLMFNSKPNGIEDSNFIVDQDFRQVLLIRDPQTAAGSQFTTASGKVVQSLKLQATAAAGFLDATIEGQTSGAKAIVDEVDEDKLFFHQTETTGFTQFQEGETITGGGETGTLEAGGVDADSDAFVVSDVKKNSGTVVYIENRSPVTRAANQQEDIKVVITF